MLRPLQVTNRPNLTAFTNTDQVIYFLKCRLPDFNELLKKKKKWIVLLSLSKSFMTHWQPVKLELTVSVSGDAFKNEEQYEIGEQSTG